MFNINIIFGFTLVSFGIDAVLLELLVLLQFMWVRHLRCWQLPGIQFAEVDFLEPRVTLQLLSARLSAAQSACWILGQQAEDDVFALGRQPARPWDVELQYFLEQPLLLRRHEWRYTDCHFLNQAPQGPEVHLLRVPLPQDDFRRKLFRRAHLLHIVYLRAKLALGQPEVSQFALPVRVYHQVLRFQIPLEYLILVQVLQHQHHLRGVELGPYLWQFLVGLDVLEDFPSLAEVHHHL